MGQDIRETPICEETVFHGALIDVSHMRVALPDGRTALREIVRHRGAAAVVPVDENGVVTLVRQYRAAIGREMLEIPAGKLDAAGEEPSVCAHRELEEETGLRAGRMRFLVSMIATPGYCTERVALYLATELSQHEAHLDADEFLNVVRMPLEEAAKRALAGEFSDAKTALGLLMAWELAGGRAR